MVLNYKIDFENGVFKYNCILYSSYLRIRDKDMGKIHGILNKIDVFREQHEKDRTKRFTYNGFEIILDSSGYFTIQNTSNWLDIKEEVPIIKRELIKYIKKYDTESVKDIIIKIKSLKGGSSNKIKEDLK